MDHRLRLINSQAVSALAKPSHFPIKKKFANLFNNWLMPVDELNSSHKKIGKPLKMHFHQKRNHTSSQFNTFWKMEDIFWYLDDH